MRRREFLLILGGAVWPFDAGAQPASKGTRRIAIVNVRGPAETISEESSSTWRAFFTELRRRGYAEGKNLWIEPRLKRATRIFLRRSMNSSSVRRR
jgi:hypothetical protein